MRNNHWLKFCVISVLTLVPIGGGVWIALPFIYEESGADPDDIEQVALGRNVYTRACANCHGVSLEGEPNWRNRNQNGRLPAPPHDETGHTWHHPDEVLFEITKYGYANIVPGGYRTDMPIYDGVLSDEEIWAVLAFIKSSWPESIRQRQEQLNNR